MHTNRSASLVMDTEQMKLDCGDMRLNRAGQDLHAAMVEHQSVCLRRLGQGRSQEVRYGRVLRNKRVTVQKLIEGACQGIGERSAQRHVLLIQDTSELNYQAHAQRVKGLGTVGNGVDIGMFIHPVLAVDAQDGACLGLAHLHLWQRTRKKAANYRQLPIQDKESVRWIESIEQARQRLGQAGQMTVVADRESDIYEMWERLPDARTHLLVRACRDRAVEHTGDGTLFQWLQGQPEQGRYELRLQAVAGRRSAHSALMQVRFSPVRIKRPRHGAHKQGAPSVALWAIEVKEDASTVVGKQAPIHWRLLTTHAIGDMADALRCVHWYCQRWHIEQTFRTLKLQGLDVESSLLEQAPRLEKLTVLAMSAAVQTMQLTLARQGKSQRPATDCFAAHEHALLGQVGQSLEGKTLKQKNPHAPCSLAWAAWIVARLGGWKGYASERPPGPITMLHGLQALANIRRGWALARAPA